MWLVDNFRAKTEGWRQEMTSEDYDGVENVLKDNAFLKLGACCLTLEQGFKDEKSFHKRVREILATRELHLEAAIYLIYHKATNYKKAQNLLSAMQKKDSLYFKAPSEP